MRQGQQNRRGRGRNNNNNNRKSQNPLTRSFESTGPDVKLRGTPSHIAEKYVSLARDALSSGDPVLAENYLQHAEHYNRIILGVREQQMSQGGMDPFNNGAMRTHTLASADGSEGEEFGDEEGGEDFGAQPQPQVGQGEGQPQGFQQPQRNFDSPQRFDNRPRHDNYNRDNRGEHRHNNQRFDRGDRQDFRGPRQDRGDRGDRGFRDDRRQHGGSQHDYDNGGNGYRRRDRYQGNGNGNAAGIPDTEPPQATQPVTAERAPTPPTPPPEQEQPAFLRRPVRRPRREESEETAAATPARPASDDQE